MLLLGPGAFLTNNIFWYKGVERLYILSWDTNLKVRLVGETLFNIFFWMYFPFLTLYFSGEFGKGTAGLLMSIPPLIGIFGTLFGGYMADTLGRRKTMLIGSFMQAGMFALFAISLSNWMDYVAYIGISLGGSIYYPASSSMVADLTKEEDRREVFATFVTATNIGAVIGPLLGAIFFFEYREVLLWTCTLITFIYSVVIYLLIEETKPHYAINNGRNSNVLFVFQDQWKNYSIIFLDKVFAFYILAGIFVTVAFRQLNMYLAVYVEEYVPKQTFIKWGNWEVELSGLEIFGWMLGVNGLLFVIGVIPITKWFHNWKDRDALILSSLLFGLGMFLMGFTTYIWLLFVFTIIFTIGEIMNGPVANSFVSKYAPEESRGKYMGAANLQNAVGRFIAPITVILSTTISPIGVFGCIFLFTIISSWIYYLVFKKIPNETESS